MNTMLKITLISLTLTSQSAFSQPFEIDWYTIDAGGGTSSGHSFDLACTIGQPDASDALVGGTFVLLGGFIPGSGSTGTPGCNPADLAEPYGELNFFDVSAFLQAYSSNDQSADINNDGMFNFFDVSAFLNQFAAGCP